MIRIRVRRDGAGRVTGFTVRGHAGYAEAGRDIVCAGVTAVVFTALLGLRSVARIPHTVRQEDREGYIDCRLEVGTPDAERTAQAILETMVLGLRDIEKDYGDYVRVTEGG